VIFVKCLNATFKYFQRKLSNYGVMEKNLSAKISFSLLWIYEKIVTCKRDPEARDRDETETLGKCVSRPSRDRDVETETTSLVVICIISISELLSGSQLWPYKSCTAPKLVSRSLFAEHVHFFTIAEQYVIEIGQRCR